jgi:hypothetical protein
MQLRHSIKIVKIQEYISFTPELDALYTFLDDDDDDDDDDEWCMNCTETTYKLRSL